jgi:hypothetical protein
VGDVVESGKELLLKVKGTKEVFRLDDEPEPKAGAREGTAFQRLQTAVARGQTAINITGRVKGWTGHFPAVLRELPAEFTPVPKNQHGPPARRPPLLYVVGFAEAKN